MHLEDDIRVFKNERKPAVQTNLKKVIARHLMLLPFCLSHLANAQDELGFIQKEMAYSDVRASLIKKGWMTLNNPRVGQSSLYAQEIFDQGYTEVVDCISMALDGCQFRFKQKNVVLEINTITRKLLVESHIIKK
jgi:hypothetical protein